MTFLIDTHTFLWFINGSNKLSKTAKELIEKDNNDIFISPAFGKFQSKPQLANYKYQTIMTL